MGVISNFIYYEVSSSKSSCIKTDALMVVWLTRHREWQREINDIISIISSLKLQMTLPSFPCILVTKMIILLNDQCHPITILRNFIIAINSYFGLRKLTNKTISGKYDKYMGVASSIVWNASTANTAVNEAEILSYFIWAIILWSAAAP